MSYIFISLIALIAFLSPISNAGILTDVIDELTPGAGVTVDGILMKDGTVTAPGNITADSFTLTDGTPISGSGSVTSTAWDGSNWTSDDTAPSQSAVQGALLTATKDVTDTTYELITADAGKLLTLTNASPITVTVPTGLSAYGRSILIRQGGAGGVTISGAVGVTIDSPVDTALSTTYETGELLPVGNNRWQFFFRSRGVAPWTPESIDGLSLWLDASQITGLSDGDGIATWADASAESNDATQSTAGSRPLYKTNILNGKPVVRFDGSDDWLDLGDLTILEDAKSVFYVARPVAEAGAGSIISNGRTANDAQYWYVGFLASGFYRAQGSSNTFGSNELDGNADLRGAWRVFTTITVFSESIARGGVNGGTYGTSRKSNTLTDANSTRIGTLFYFTIGNILYFSGDIAEILVYDSALSDANRVAVEEYLSEKYDIAL